MANPFKSNLKRSIEIRSSDDEHTEWPTPRQEFLIDQTTCCLCGGPLSFLHQTDHFELTVIEESKCMTCQVPMRKRSHGLH